VPTGIAFIGSKKIGLRALQAIDHPALVIALDDRDDDRTVLPELEAAANGAPFVVAKDNAEALAAISRMQPAIAIVCGWYRRIPTTGSTTFYGIHASPLPRYRGQAPVPWQIINGESSIGLTLFRFVDEIDAGPIICQDSVPLAADDTAGDALDSLIGIVGELVADGLAKIREGYEGKPQNPELATYCGPRRPEHGAIDWTRSALDIHNFVRAQSRPYPGAFTDGPAGERRVWRTRPDSRAYLAVPGVVCERGDGGVLVGCGDGAVWILEADGIEELRVGIQLGPRRATG
jgi:methionyl-tRNA formyltransferase